MRKLIFVFMMVLIATCYYVGHSQYVDGSSDKVPRDAYSSAILVRDTIKTTEYYDSMFFVRQERFDTVGRVINVVTDTVDYWAYLDGKLITRKQIVYESACMYFPILMSKCKE